MDTGTKISAAAHLILIGWALFGSAFRPEPLPFEVREVSLISVQEFAALTAAPVVPDVAEQPASLAPPPETAPESAPEAPQPAAEPDTPPDRAPPETAPEPQAETPPETVSEPPVPEPVVPEAAPQIEPPAPEIAALPPEPRPQPRPVERVAPQPAAPPPPEARPDEVAKPEVAPEQGAEAPSVPQEATAPPEATDRIVTEADQGKALAPTSSPRPKVRPKPPAVAAARPEPAARPAAPDTRQAVDAALAEALGGDPAAAPAAAAIPSGPPMTDGEKDALRVAVQQCWNVGSLSSAALATTVEVAVTLSQDGKPDGGSIRMLSSSGGTGDAAKQAFEAARRAIIRCGASGFDLPADKYGQWRDIEMTFNPERMRIK